MRADLLLVARGLAESRAQARAAIEAGGVSAGGRRIDKPSDLIAEDAALDYTPPHPWVSRAGVKLTHALEEFGIDPRGRVCLDVGAATGGFTQVLLEAGAAKIYAVDVGQGQLHPKIRGDSRVVVLEKTDARALTRDLISEAPGLIVCDASFIGAAKALTVPLTLAADSCDLITLIKPQFEAGPNAGKHGVLDEIAARKAAAVAMAGLDGLEGFQVRAFADSPIRGGEGNLELLMWATRP